MQEQFSTTTLVMNVFFI